MHVSLWQFTVLPDKRSEFIAAYGPDGLWAQLFRQVDGYHGTELLCSDDQNRFVTIDRWASVRAFQDFQARFSQEYKKLDMQLEELTLGETKIGSFNIVS